MKRQLIILAILAVVMLSGCKRDKSSIIKSCSYACNDGGYTGFN